MWNGLRCQEALEGGVFTKKTFIDVGSPDEPVPYSSSNLPDRDAFKGKQFQTQATKTGRLPKDMLDPAFKPLFEGQEYTTSIPYRELQPEKPGKGFMTSDYSRRDEFSLTIRMQQQREQIKHEARVQKEAEAKLAAKGGSPPSGGAGAGSVALEGGGSKGAEGPLLFDRVFEGEAELCIKAKRDTRNPCRLSTERNVGSYQTVARMAHSAPPKAPCPPEHGIKKAVFD